MKHKLTQKQIENVVERAARALFRYCQDSEIHYVVTGSSGGLDSAITLALAERACGLAKKDGYKLCSVGLIMPSHSKPDAERLGREAIKKFNAEEIFIELSGAFDFIAEKVLTDVNLKLKDILAKHGNAPSADWEWSDRIARGNIKSRLRMMCGTYHVARMLKGIVLSTDNLSEYWMAFWTLHGDVGDFGMIQNIMKGLELYDIARYLGVPQEIIDARPDDGLGISSGDEDQLGAAYPILDQTLVSLIQKGFNVDGAISQLDNLPETDGVPNEAVRRLAERALHGAHKRKGTKNLSREELGLPDLSEICVKRRIAIYGGSFNPPGLHHREVAEELAKRFDLVVVCPCGRRRDKPSANLVSLEHRKEMARMAFDGLPNTRIDPYDLENDTYTPTYYLQERYEKIFEDAEIWHVVGTDLVAGGRDGDSDIEKNWTYGKIIWQTLNFVVVRRLGYAILPDDLPPSSELLEFQRLVGSGTMIRELIKQNEPIDRLVLPEVAEYIKKHGLYRLLT